MRGKPMAQIDETSRELGAHSSAIRILNDNMGSLNDKVEGLDEKIDKGFAEIKQLHEREKGQKEAYGKVWKTAVSIVSVIGVVLGGIAVL